MKNLKNTLIISSYVLLVALFFGGGYAIGRIGTTEKPSAVVVQTPPVIEAVAGQEVESPVYEVIIEDGILKINKCIGEIKTVVVSEEISENVFPYDDIEELRRGVIFERLEQAQQMFENFVS